jgi:hypothetical protein
MLGPELVCVCMLFRENSVVASDALATLIKYIAGQSSIIATLPLIGSTVLRSLLHGRTAADLSEYYTPEIRKQLSGLAGRPVFAKLLGEICSHVADLAPASRGRNSPVLRDCNTVITFLLYLCDNVQLAFEADVRARLMTQIAEEGWSLAQGGGTGEECGYDTRSFLHSGIHAPCLSKVHERGDYPKDKKAAEESSAREGGCDKPFESSRKKTGNPVLHLLHLLSITRVHYWHYTDGVLCCSELCRGALYLCVQASRPLRCSRDSSERREK